MIHGWLSGTDRRLKNGAIAVLQSAQKHRPDRTAELLRPYIGQSDYWDERLAGIVRLSNIGATRDYFDFVCEVVRSGVFDLKFLPSQTSGDFWFHIEDLVEQKPEWACELIACCFAQLTEMAAQEPYASTFLETGYPVGRGVQVITDAARAMPEHFTESLMPHFLTLMQLSQDEPGDPNLSQSFWHYPTSRGRHRLDVDLISGMEIALCGLARQNPQIFLSHAIKLRRSEFSIIQAILAKAYSVNGELFADEAVKYLLEDCSRFGGRLGRREVPCGETAH